MASHPDGKGFASATFGLAEDDKRVADLRTWNLDGSLGGSDVGEIAFFGIGYSPNGDVLAAGCQDGVLRLYSPDGHLKNKFSIQSLDSRTSEPSVAWSPDGKQIASAGPALSPWSMRRSRQTPVVSPPRHASSVATSS